MLHFYLVKYTWANRNNKTGLYLGKPKTKNSYRDYPFGEQVKNAFLILKAYHEKVLGRSIDSQAAKDKNLFVMCNILGRCIDGDYFADKFKTFCKEAGLHEITVHGTRHTFATVMLKRYPSELATISKQLLGHAQSSTTLNLYGHTFDERKREIMDLMDSI